MEREARTLAAAADGRLFETEEATSRGGFRLFVGSVLAAAVLVWIHRALQLASGGCASGLQRWGHVGTLAADLWFGFYWVLEASARWNPVRRLTFKDRLSRRYKDKLPAVDVFVCTADPQLEPPVMVMNTILSVMAYDYPPQKLAVYLSDDAGSIFTFYALWEASRFAHFWIPFCKRFNVTSHSPANYFAGAQEEQGARYSEHLAIRELYEEMATRVSTAIELGEVPKHVRDLHKGFSEWDLETSAQDHHAIVQVLVDGRDRDARDVEGVPLPTLVYVAREKRPQHFHNFKAGAMNALIRVSSVISNGPIILNLDCDVYSNDQDTIRDVMCFFMDEEKGGAIGYVQYPYLMENVMENDLYGNALKIIHMEFHGLDGNGGPLYIGSCCFHRRMSLLGNKVTQEHRYECEENPSISTLAMEERAISLCISTSELNTQWGKQVGLRYGYPVEDVVTGLSILCNGWKAVYRNPTRPPFFGLAPVTLMQTLVQHKRWSEGDFQLFLSKYCPFICGHGKVSMKLQMSYSIYFLWALNSFPTLFYATIPSLLLLVGDPLFPSLSSLWSVPFTYVAIAKLAQSIFESRQCGQNLKAWWNDQRMWLYKRTTSYLFAAIDTFLKLAGLQNSTFVITAKVVDDDVLTRYKKEMMEFGMDSPMLTILCTLAMLNLVCLVGGTARVVLGVGLDMVKGLWAQLVLCGALVVINGPLFGGMFVRKDGGRVPLLVVCKGCALAMGICVLWVSMRVM